MPRLSNWFLANLVSGPHSDKPALTLINPPVFIQMICCCRHNGCTIDHNHRNLLLKKCGKIKPHNQHIEIYI